jgi:RNA polymerase sigma-70 factor (ECF subfamily)
MELSALLPRVRSGDELAWEAFVRRFQGRIFGLAYHYVGQADDAQDLAQEAFCRVYQNLERIPDPDGLVPWMLAITRNACMDHFRRRKARPQTWDIPVEEMFQLQADGADPDRQHLEAVRRDLVHTALRGLTGLNREMILLKEIQGLSLDEIARILGVPLGTVKSRSVRARLELAEALTAMGV